MYKIEMRFFFGALHYQSRTTVAYPFCKIRKLLFGSFTSVVSPPFISFTEFFCL